MSGSEGVNLTKGGNTPPGFTFVPFVIFCLNRSWQRQLEASPSFLAASVLLVSP